MDEDERDYAVKEIIDRLLSILQTYIWRERDRQRERARERVIVTELFRELRKRDKVQMKA